MIKNLGIVTNVSKPQATEFGREVCAFFEKKGLAVEETRQYPVQDNFLSGKDLCIVIGGDGSLLGLTQQAVAFGTPILGINSGKLGFLTALNKNEFAAFADDIIQQKYSIDERNVLRCFTGEIDHGFALNDVVIKPLHSSKLIQLSVFVRDMSVTEYSSDGLIFSTATGSTAYNLSAGGPIIHPNADVIVATPICPHTLTHRSIIFPTYKELDVHMTDRSIPVQVSLDGVPLRDYLDLFPLKIRLSAKKVSLVSFGHRTYFEILRSKLGWGTTKALDARH